MHTLARIRRRTLLLAAIAAPSLAAAQPRLPDRLSDREFWQLVGELSEPGGYFRSDNFLSNETTFQHAIPRLASAERVGGVYLGVGPEQNFTYLVALRPRMAFILDIRRQNMIEHLLYKALMEMAPTRADFLSLLFARRRPAGLDSASSVNALFQAYVAAVPDSALYRRTVQAVAEALGRHSIVLDSADRRSLGYVYEAFFAAGPELNYSFSAGAPGMGGMRAGFYGRRMPTYAELMTQTDSAGVQRSYLATEASYGTLRDMQARNVIVPLVGDFAGPKAIRAVGDWVRARGGTVSAFYISNVEQYLFRQGDDWKRFFENVATLPTDTSSTFIRAIFNGMGRGASPGPPGMRSVMVLCGIQTQVRAYAAGTITDYRDVMCP